jgi:hypothetical protein
VHGGAPVERPGSDGFAPDGSRRRTHLGHRAGENAGSDGVAQERKGPRRSWTRHAFKIPFEYLT